MYYQLIPISSYYGYEEDCDIGGRADGNGAGYGFVDRATTYIVPEIGACFTYDQLFPLFGVDPIHLVVAIAGCDDEDGVDIAYKFKYHFAHPRTYKEQMMHGMDCWHEEEEKGTEDKKTVAVTAVAMTSMPISPVDLEDEYDTWSEQEEEDEYDSLIYDVLSKRGRKEGKGKCKWSKKAWKSQRKNVLKSVGCVSKKVHAKAVPIETQKLVTKERSAVRAQSNPHYEGFSIDTKRFVCEDCGKTCMVGSELRKAEMDYEEEKSYDDRYGEFVGKEKICADCYCAKNPVCYCGHCVDCMSYMCGDEDVGHFHVGRDIYGNEEDDEYYDMYEYRLYEAYDQYLVHHNGGVDILGHW
jgi:hypothetical protein